MPRAITRAAPTSRTGTLAARPPANTVRPGSEYFATDDNGGTLYICDAVLGWLTAGPRGIELGYTEITSNIATVSGSSAFADVPGWAVTVTPRERPLLVRAWISAPPTTDTAGGGAKWRIQRTDTSAVMAEQDANNPVAGGVLALSSLHKRISLPSGVAITFKVQIGGRTSGVATFPATVDQPLAIQVVEV